MSTTITRCRFRASPMTCTLSLILLATAPERMVCNTPVSLLSRGFFVVWLNRQKLTDIRDAKRFAELEQRGNIYSLGIAFVVPVRNRMRLHARSPGEALHIELLLSHNP